MAAEMSRMLRESDKGDRRLGPLCASIKNLQCTFFCTLATFGTSKPASTTAVQRILSPSILAVWPETWCKDE